MCRINLGTAVCICVTVARDPALLRTVEGVVIEVVRPRHLPTTIGGPQHRRDTRYVVQCDGWRALLRRRDMLVVSP